MTWTERDLMAAFERIKVANEMLKKASEMIDKREFANISSLVEAAQSTVYHAERETWHVVSDRTEKP